MAVIVSYVRTGGLGLAQAIVDARLTESVSVPGTTAGAAGADEAALIVNNESDPVKVAWGSTPDAAATSRTDATSAYVSIPAGQSVVVRPKSGDKINVKS